MANRLPSITITGADGLIDLLRTLPEKQILPAVNKGMRAVGSKTIRDAKKYLKRNHGLDTGQMKKSLGVRKIKTYKREGRVVMYIGPRRGFGIVKKNGKKHDPFYIAHLVEFGHRIAVGASGRPEKGVKFRRTKYQQLTNPNGPVATVGGIVRPRPFLRPAVDANKGEFNKQMAEKIRSVLAKAKARGK
jgi:HK97 gp10 family phage protein